MAVASQSRGPSVQAGQKSSSTWEGTKKDRRAAGPVPAGAQVSGLIRNAASRSIRDVHSPLRAAGTNGRTATRMARKRRRTPWKERTRRGAEWPLAGVRPWRDESTPCFRRRNRRTAGLATLLFRTHSTAVVTQLSAPRPAVQPNRLRDRAQKDDGSAAVALGGGCASTNPRRSPQPLTRRGVGASRSETLDDGRVGHAAALAHGLQAVAAAGLLPEQGGHQPGAARAERMAERGGAAVDVDPGEVRPGLGLPGQGPRSQP